MFFQLQSIILILAVISVSLKPLGRRRFNKNLLTSGTLTNAQLREVCGLINLAEGKVMGGEKAALDAWPWMVAIFEAETFVCGGVLINYRYILTADHCLRYGNTRNMLPAKLFSVRLGELDLDSNDDGAHPVNFKVSKLIAHKNYNPKAAHNPDIALMALDRNVTFSPSILPICLPESPELTNSTYVGMHPFVTGWGCLDEIGSIKTVLQQVALDVYPIIKCQDIFEGVGDDTVCAGKDKKGKDSCSGDSGGPLMTTDSNNQMNVIGIVSGGGRCERPTTPGIYTRVATHLKWIKETAGMM